MLHYQIFALNYNHISLLVCAIFADFTISKSYLLNGDSFLPKSVLCLECPFSQKSFSLKKKNWQYWKKKMFNFELYIRVFSKRKAHRFEMGAPKKNDFENLINSLKWK